MKKKLVILLVIGIAVGFFAYRYVLRPSQKYPDHLFVSGNIEVTEVQVSFKIPGRVEERLVDEGQTVRTGQIVARLDSRDLAQELAIRQAELKVAQTFLSELLAGSRPQEIAAAQATVNAARAEFADAESNFKRLDGLRKNNLVAQQEYDSAKARYDATRSRLKESQERLKLVQEGPRKEEIEQARAKVQQAKAAEELAQIRLNYATLHSPITGVVLSKNIEPGEYVVPGTPIVTVADLVNAWLRVYINETDLGRIKLGQKVHIMTDTYPGKVYEGRLSFISSEAEFTPKNVQTQKERVKLVYRVKLDVKNTSMELKPGMPADAIIFLGTDSHDQRH